MIELCLIGIAILNLLATVCLIYLVLKAKRDKPCLQEVKRDNPGLPDGFVLPTDCRPRRFGDHRMDDVILCVKNVWGE